eukprot:m.16428 g.16428  ORF g.16428 m.16428 type:complete len:244 (+) comp5049_c0_seq1:253-984(+)
MACLRGAACGCGSDTGGSVWELPLFAIGLSGGTLTVTARTVDGDAFLTCPSVAPTIRITSSVRTLHTASFQRCNVVTLIVEPGVTSIPNDFCAFCQRLANLWLPSGISIGPSAFRFGPTLTGQVFIGANAQFGLAAFGACGLTSLSGTVSSEECRSGCSSTPCSSITPFVPPTSAAPSRAPTRVPTVLPTSASPSRAPSRIPTTVPTSASPSRAPSRIPTAVPTSVSPSTASPVDLAPSLSST